MENALTWRRHFFVHSVNKRIMSVYGTNAGYSLNEAPLTSFSTPRQELIRKNASLYTPNIIAMEPAWTTNSMAMAVASTEADSRGPNRVECANAEEAALMGTAKCISPETMKCVRLVNNMCPKGYFTLINGQVSRDVPTMSGYAPFR